MHIFREVQIEKKFNYTAGVKVIHEVICMMKTNVTSVLTGIRGSQPFQQTTCTIHKYKNKTEWMNSSFRFLFRMIQFSPVVEQERKKKKRKKYALRACDLSVVGNKKKKRQKKEFHWANGSTVAVFKNFPWRTCASLRNTAVTGVCPWKSFDFFQIFAFNLI